MLLALLFIIVREWLPELCWSEGAETSAMTYWLISNSRAGDGERGRDVLKGRWRSIAVASRDGGDGIPGTA